MKKFFKVFALIMLVFLVFLYFLGSCTSDPEHNKNDNVVEFHEVTPEEYEKEMQKLIGSQASFDFSLTAYADNVIDDVGQVYKDMWESTPAYNIYDYLKSKSELDTVNNTHGGGGHYRYPSTDDKSTAIINYEYDIYGKNRVVYSNGTWEIIECRILTSAPVTTGLKTGAVKYTRTNQNYSTTSFSFDISLYGLSQSFGSSSAFTFSFTGLDSYCAGCSENFIKNYLKKSHFLRFEGSNVNSLKQFDVSTSTAILMQFICYDSWSGSYPNVFSICSSVSNDYEFSQSIDNYYAKFGLWKMPNLYYNNNAGDTINQTNINNYKQYGYTYNEITNSIEFDPDVFLNYFDLNIKPQLQAEFDSIFSKFPDINAKFGDLEIEYTNLVDIINNINNSTTTTTTTVTGTYPIVTTGGGGCDCDIYVTVTVDVTFPEEFYKKYPTLTTEPAFVADSPDIDYALDEPLPLEILGSAGQFLTTFSDILTDNGLMPLYMMCIALSLVAFFLL